MVAGNYVVEAVQTQIILQGAAGREIWLGVDLQRGGTNITGWMQSGGLQRRVPVAGGGDWLARLRGGARKGGVWRKGVSKLNYTLGSFLFCQLVGSQAFFRHDRSRCGQG